MKCRSASIAYPYGMATVVVDTSPVVIIRHVAAPRRYGTAVPGRWYSETVVTMGEQ